MKNFNIFSFCDKVQIIVHSCELMTNEKKKPDELMVLSSLTNESKKIKIMKRLKR
jgi:hypothetical protein